jgi:ornithine decarboxylase
MESKGVKLNVLNIGGGFPIEYTRPVPSLAEIADLINKAVPDYFSPDINIMAAPGRALVGDAGILVTSVIANAVRDGQNWLYVDIGVFNGLMETVGGIQYPVSLEKVDNTVSPYVLAGPSCDGFDVISKEVKLPESEIGDRLYIMATGAYTTAYASQFDGFPIPKIIYI